MTPQIEALKEKIPALKEKVIEAGRTDLIPVLDNIDVSLTNNNLSEAMRQLLPLVRVAANRLRFPYDFVYLISFRLCMAEVELKRLFGH